MIILVKGNMSEVEIFVPIEGYDDEYFVSTYGNILSMKYNRRKRLKPYDTQRGYLKIDLRKDGKRNSTAVHRIVAQTFIPNPEGLPEVDHIDCNGFNNNISNLRWVSSSTNSRNKLKVRTDSRSGIQGVHYNDTRKDWMAVWVDDKKKSCCKRFSLRRYGDDAKTMAINHRNKMILKYYERT